jgi:hypothetical protein
MLNLKSEYGVLVTTSELALVQKVISVRGYPIQAVERSECLLGEATRGLDSSYLTNVSFMEVVSSMPNIALGTKRVS